MDFDDMFDDRTEEERKKDVGVYEEKIIEPYEEEAQEEPKKLPEEKQTDDFYGNMQRQVDDLIKTEKAKNRPDTRVILEALKLKADLQDKKLHMATNLLKMSRTMKQNTPEQRRLI